MANNRLWLLAKNGDRVLLAKGWGIRWEVSGVLTDSLPRWLDDHVSDEADVGAVTTLRVESDGEKRRKGK